MTVINCLFGTFILVILVLLIYCNYLQAVEPYTSTIDGRDYKIVSSFSDNTHVEAANKLAIINKFISDLNNHLSKKYILAPKETLDDTNATRIKIGIVKNIIKRYSPDVLKENNPITTDNTSYVLNKGDEIAFCLREKDSGFNRFHDVESLKFVVLHELAHLGMDEYGHELDFWKAFHFLTKEAHDAKLYEPIDYSLDGHNMTYCGVKVTFNPFFHNKLSYS